jgi:hypothetical protein
MKKIIFTLITLTSLSACFQKNDKNSEGKNSTESQVVSVDSKSVVENYERLIKKYKTSGEEDWLTIISADLIFIGEIETNRNQPYPERGMYQCHLSTKLLRLSDGKEITYSDIFSAQEKIVVNAIYKYMKVNNINVDENHQESINKSLVDFYTLNNKEFNLINYESIADTCNPLFEKEIPISVITPHLTKWMKQQLQISD